VLLVDALLLGVAAGLVTGGSISALREVRLRFEMLMLGLLVFPAVLPTAAIRIGLSGPVALEMWVIAMCILCILAMTNARNPGMPLVALGVAANALVIVLNGGMPVLLTAYVPLGGPPIDPVSMAGDLLHVPLGQSTLLGFLSDVIPVPGPQWHRAVVSIGDVLLCAGVALFIAYSMKSKSAHSTD